MLLYLFNLLIFLFETIGCEWERERERERERKRERETFAYNVA